MVANRVSIIIMVIKLNKTLVILLHCRMLGFANGTTQVSNHCGHFEGDDAGDSTPIWINHVQCSGNEKDLEACYFEGWGGERYTYPYGSGVCTHSNDARVECADSKNTPQPLPPPPPPPQYLCSCLQFLI